MKTNSYLKTLVAACLLLLSVPALAQFKVVGYMPSWNGDVNAVQYDKLTHINYAFLLPNGDGSLRPIENPGKLQSLVSASRSRGVKVLIAVGGWNDGNDSAFEQLAANATARTNFVNNLVGFVNQYNLDGVDMDWEYPDAGASASNYAAMMQQLGSALRSRGKLLTAAVVGINGGSILNSVFNDVDFLNLMAYDANNFDHSTFDFAVQSINYWKGRGLPASKTVLGVPFYGRPSWESYATLLSRGADPNADVFNGIGYNGITTIKRKTNLAFDQGGGIMMWELSQDATGPNSLLTAINQVVRERSGGGSGVATFFKNCNYDGAAVALPVGDYTLGQLQARGILNDDVSSIRVSGGYQVVLYENDNFSGASLTVGADNGCLVNNPLGAGNWNDKVSSVRVQTASSGFSTTIQAEAFSNMSGVQVEACTEGGQNVGYIDQGDWLAYYNVTFPTSGTYTIEYRVASLSGSRLSSDLNAGAIQLGNVDIPATGGWQTWTMVSQTVNVQAGTYNFGVYAQAGGWNLNWIRISRAGASRVAASSAATLAASEVEPYPNPVAGRLHFRSARNLAGSTYQVLDAYGQVQAAGTLGTDGADVASLRAGVYTLCITTKERQKITRRLVKQ
ncbi:glycosyl hydrolase family 18 protein [Hymenobacter weizhouensis]|uniref:glycosyl hydrolase family 18 protein n=1 Tax=Hymenobacter sp. YIM 151500-1 TaxID=2987689 RepID=UPI002226E89B|nr:glycosyl hydrolase family 18 protein [Hymenobacter sp. YIM 151500-1]UYZ63109.1 glycosyl hydrolase family 18 protein [Hymenobacter sp. YIM 151500-1]